MKNLLLILGALCMLVFVSCSEEVVVEEVTPIDNTRFAAKYHWSHVNPDGVVFTVYQGSAFCGDGLNQIQIWAPNLSTCECLLANFVADCDEEINWLYPCQAKNSQYPPLAEFCTQ